MLTVADMGEEGVKNLQKSADVVYGRSLTLLFLSVYQQQSHLHLIIMKMTSLMFHLIMHLLMSHLHCIMMNPNH